MSISFSDLKSLSCNGADILKIENLAGQIIWSETFDISYNANGGEMPAVYEVSYRYGKGLSALPIPTRNNYKFNGWQNNAIGDFITTITTTDKANFNLSASWTYTPPTPTYRWSTFWGPSTDNSLFQNYWNLICKSHTPVSYNSGPTGPNQCSYTEYSPDDRTLYRTIYVSV